MREGPWKWKGQNKAELENLDEVLVNVSSGKRFSGGHVVQRGIGPVERESQGERELCSEALNGIQPGTTRQKEAADEDICPLAMDLLVS